MGANRIHFGKLAYSNQASGVPRSKLSFNRDPQVRANRAACQRGMSFIRGTSAKHKLRSCLFRAVPAEEGRRTEDENGHERIEEMDEDEEEADDDDADDDDDDDDD